MKKSRYLFFLCVLLVLLTASGFAAPKPIYEAEFTLPTQNVTVLQNAPDREIALLTAPVRHEAVPGESPTTGLPWEGVYLPMLVQIDNAVTTAWVKGREIKSAGIGDRAPWGIQYADVVYEEEIYAGTATRFSVLFSDSLASGQPEKGAGPVRSVRDNQLLLREEWQSGLVHNGGMVRVRSGCLVYTRPIESKDRAELFDLFSGKYTDLAYRVQGVRAPSNYNADIVGLQERIPYGYVSAPRPFLFADESPYDSQYEAAGTIHLDWGYKYGISHFQYNADQNAYLRYCGAGMEPAEWAPFASYAAVDDRSVENQQQPAFANVIIQRVDHEYMGGNRGAQPTILSVGKGNADIFIGGRYIPGYWVRTSMEDPTIFYDDQGKEIELSRGKTFIAHFSPENLCTFAAE